MSFGYFTQPLLQQKQSALDVQDLQGLWQLNWKVGKTTLFNKFYTRLDQVFLLWGLIAALIFTTAQFINLSWQTQAVFWSVLSLVGTASMITLTWFWTSVERLRWIGYCWAGLMLGGVVLTDLGVFWGWGGVLICLCPLWLGLCAVGYCLTGLGMRSQTFFWMGLVHLLGIFILPYVLEWQFLTTGIIMALSLLLLAELQWDMRSPINYSHLTPEQKQFNQQQYQLRQLSIR